MSTTEIALSEDDKRTVKAVLPVVRRESPEAARIISRLLRSTLAPEAPAVDPYASVREVARAFSVTEQTVRNWVDRGWMPGTRRFGRGPRRIPRSVLASAQALARPRPPTPDLTPEQMDAILTAPRRKRPK